MSGLLGLRSPDTHCKNTLEGNSPAKSKINKVSKN